MIALSHVLEFSRVSRSFAAGAPVLSDLSFSMQREEVVALLGRNGAGKSTLINLAMGLLAPDAGTVRAFGLSPMAHPVEVKRRVGYVSEHLLLPPRFTIRDAIDFHRKLFPTWDAAMERELLERFQLGRVVGQRLGTLSRGMRQQVALLCAVCHRPELLLLDEPAAGLDPTMRREFLETSIQLLNREGTAILFSSHHMNDVERLGGRVLLLRDARIALDASLDSLQDETCLVIVPRRVMGVADRLRAMPEVMHVRAVIDEWHAVMRGPSAQLVAELPARLGSSDVRCVRVPLEELFIQLAGNAHGQGPHS